MCYLENYFGQKIVFIKKDIKRVYKKKNFRKNVKMSFKVKIVKIWILKTQFFMVKK